jgi:hypothetical protein
VKLRSLAPRLAAIASLLLTVPALADQPTFSRASLLIPPCAMDGVSDADLRAAAALELEAQSIGLAPVGELSAADALVRFESSCLPGSEIVVHAAWAGQERARTLNIGELPARTRARALALSLAELLGSFRKGVEPEAIELSETEPLDSKEAPAPGGKDAATARPAATLPAPALSATAPGKAPPIQWVTGQPPGDRRSKRRPKKSRDPELGVSPEALMFSGGDVLSGLRPHLDAGLVSIGVSVIGGSASAEYGTVDALVMSGVCVLRVWQTAHDEPVSFSAGPRFAVGLVRAVGTPAIEGVGLEAVDLYLDAGATGMLELRPASWVRFGLGVETGYARGMVALADSTPVAEFGGVFIGGLADLSLSL